MIILTVKFDFAASHQLPFHTGLCKNLHGHTYFVEIGFEFNELDANGMATDFETLNDIANDIKMEFDHKHLNDFVKPYPTAEMIAFHIQKRLVEMNALPHHVEVRETPRYSVRIE